MLQHILSLFKNICTVDLRALGLLRISIAITLGIDLIIRVVHLVPHYSDQGILPLEALFRFGWHQHHFSLYTMGTIWQWQLSVFVVNFVCIFFLLIGYRTRLFTFLCWLFLLSLHNRNPLIHQGGDDLLRLILFWGMFLPWGYYYSSDAAASENRENRAIAYTSLAVLAYLLQIMYVYLFSALLKDSAEWHGDYTALYYALSFDQIVLPFGKWIYPHASFLRSMTACVYYIELLAPFLLLVPFRTGLFRMVFVSIMLALHAGISLSLNVGIFPLVAVAAMAGLLPGFVIDRLGGFQSIQNFKRSFEIFQWRMPKKKYDVPKEHFLLRMLSLFFIFYTFSWNLSAIGKNQFLSTGDRAWIGHFLRVDQHWGMFAPSVFKDDGYFVFEAENKKNNKVDVLSGRPVSFKKPQELQKIFRSDRWRKYSENFLFIVNAHYRPYFCFYLMNTYNQTHTGDSAVRALKIYYFKEVSLPDYKTSKPEKDLLCSCSYGSAEKE